MYRRENTGRDGHCRWHGSVHVSRIERPRQPACALFARDGSQIRHACRRVSRSWAADDRELPGNFEGRGRVPATRPWLAEGTHHADAGGHAIARAHYDYHVATGVAGITRNTVAAGRRGTATRR